MQIKPIEVFLNTVFDAPQPQFRRRHQTATTRGNRCRAAISLRIQPLRRRQLYLRNPPNSSVDTAEYISFQAILNPNGTIKVQFNDTESTADDGRLFDILDDALIGVEDATGTMGIQYRNNGGPAPMFSSPLAIAFALNNKLLPVQNGLNTEGVSVGNVFPNPSNNLFSFDFYTPQKMVLTLNLSNSLGQVVWTETHASQTGKQQKTVDAQNLPSGVYWLTVVTEQGQRFVQRVVRD